MQANGTDGSVLELLRAASASAILREILPPPSVHLLAANQPQARPDELFVDKPEVGRGGRPQPRALRRGRRSGRGLSCGGRGGGGEVGADSEGFADEEAGSVVGGEGLGG